MSVVMGSLDTRSTFQILWYRWATATFPSARYLAIADDDAYVQIAHLEADLRLTSSIVHSPWVLHGLLMWKAFYIATSHEPATEFGGWRPTDFKAAALRDHIERCRLSRLLHNASAEPAATQCERGAGCCTMRARRPQPTVARARRGACRARVQAHMQMVRPQQA